MNADGHQPVRAAVVGIGQRGLQHLNVLWRLQQEGTVQVVALCDAFAANLAQETLTARIPGFSLDGIATYHNAQAMLEEVAPDAVYLAIPPSLHQGEVIAAARAGIHIFAEKPMSLYYDEAAAMAAAIARSDVVATVGFQRRYEARNEAIHEYLRQRRTVMATLIIDRPVEAHNVKHTPTETLGGPQDRTWTKDSTWSGTTIVESAIHDTDLLRYWCGGIRWVQAAYVPRDPAEVPQVGDNPAAYSVTYGFEDGGVANLLLSRLSRSFVNHSYGNILWQHGHLRLDGEAVVAHTYRGPYPPPTRPRQEELAEAVPLPPARNANEAIHRAFITAVATGDRRALLSTFRGSLESLAAVLAANASHRLGGRRIELEAFANDEEFAPFRRKPRTAP